MVCKVLKDLESERRIFITFYHGVVFILLLLKRSNARAISYTKG